MSSRIVWTTDLDPVSKTIMNENKTFEVWKS